MNRSVREERGGEEGLRLRHLSLTLSYQVEVTEDYQGRVESLSRPSVSVLSLGTGQARPEATLVR